MLTKDEYWYWITNIQGIENKKTAHIISMFKMPEKVFYAGRCDLEKVSKLNDKDIDCIIKSREISRIKEDFSKLAAKDIRFIHIESEDYPEKLKNIYDPPYSLYVRGKLPDEKKPSAAVIGARICSNYGYTVAEKLSKELSMYGVQIISGMARGIDGAAHKGALMGSGESFGILGSGVDICYPKENIEIFTKSIENGGIISEYPVGSKALPYRFPQRNRIISAFADIVIVVEAKEKSGTFITVETALDQGKEVFAVPGRIGDSLSIGCNRLIKSGAGIVTCVKDILDELGVDCKKNDEIFRKNKNVLEKDLQVVYSCLDLLPKSIDMISDETGYENAKVVKLIVRLQLMNLVTEYTKNYYIKNI